MIRTIQRRFVTAAMAAITGLLLLLLGGINAANLFLISQRLDHTLEILTDVGGNPGQRPPAPHSAPSGGPFPFGMPGRQNDYDLFMASNYFVVRFDQQGSVIFVDVSRTSVVEEAEAAELAEEALQSGKLEGESGRYRYRIRRFREGGTAIFLDTAEESAAFWQVLILSAGAGLCCWGIMLTAVILLSKRAIRPIAENIQRQKQFVTNAGHEIKTPLAIIQSNTEALELYTGESKWSRNIKEQTVRLGGLIRDLLLLARMDEGSAQTECTDFSLSELLAGALEDFAQPIEAKSLQLQTEIQPEIWICADKKQVSQLLSILLDNGVKYSDEGGRLEAVLERCEGKVKLRLQNTCSALPQVPPEKLFDRFYRADPVRSQKSGGYGIGLSMAQSLAQANRAELSAKYIQPDIICFTLRFKP